MKFLLVALLIGAVALWPFVALKKPWALMAWRRVRLLFYVYVLAIAISAAVWLVTRWDVLYG